MKSSHHPTPSLLIFSSSINDQYLPSIQQSRLVPRFNRPRRRYLTIPSALLSSPLPLSTNSKLFAWTNFSLIASLYHPMYIAFAEIERGSASATWSFCIG
jgi:hypothetical protein